MAQFPGVSSWIGEWREEKDGGSVDRSSTGLDLRMFFLSCILWSFSGINARTKVSAQPLS